MTVVRKQAGNLCQRKKKLLEKLDTFGGEMRKEKKGGTK